MVEQPAFKGGRLASLQRAFAAHIRDPASQPRPAGVEERRMAVYRELVFNNVASLLAANFPVIRGVLDDDRWDGLIRGFFIHHRCATPLFHELGQEFLAYLSEARTGNLRDPPFLLELAHYEWVELALDISDDEPNGVQCDPNGDLMTGHPVVSPLAWNLSYRFPVHCIGPAYLPDAPPAEPTRLVVYRTRQGHVEFLEVNAVTQRLLQLLEEDPAPTGLKALTRIAEELRHPRPELVTESGRALLLDLRRRDILLGTRH
jgi:uncharacterized protein